MHVQLRSPGVATKITGGNFSIPEYGIFIDFGACDGVVDVAWRGALDAHFTTEGRLPLEEERWGSSVQVSRRLATLLGQRDPATLRIRIDDEWETLKYGSKARKVVEEVNKSGEQRIVDMLAKQVQERLDFTEGMQTRSRTKRQKE